MFHPLQKLFSHTRIGWEETDIKYFIQHYLQEKIRTQNIYCEKVQRGVAVIRVGSPAAQQEVTLLEFDLARDLLTQTHYTLNRLIVYGS